MCGSSTAITGQEQAQGEAVRVSGKGTWQSSQEEEEEEGSSLRSWQCCGRAQTAEVALEPPSRRVSEGTTWH